MDTPAALVRAYIRMMPRLQAEEQLAAISVGTIGSGNADQQFRMRAIGQLQRKALGERYRVKKATRGDLAAMGIGARTVPPEGASEGSKEPLSNPASSGASPAPRSEPMDETRAQVAEGDSAERDHA